MEHYAMRQSNEAHHYAQNGPYEASPPYEYTPRPLYPRTIGYATPDREYYGERPNMNSAYGHEPAARPYSSSSDAYGSYPSFEAVLARPLLLPPLPVVPIKTCPEAQNPFPRIEERRVSFDAPAPKRRKMIDEYRYSGEDTSPGSDPGDPTSPQAPIDPELEQASEHVIVDKTALPSGSSSPSTSESPKRAPKDYETAAILLTMSFSGRVQNA